MSEWIDVNTDKPEIGIKVLIYCDALGITTGYYWHDKQDKIPHEDCKGWSIMNVTHWMPLPPPPTKL